MHTRPKRVIAATLFLTAMAACSNAEGPQSPAANPGEQQHPSSDQSPSRLAAAHRCNQLAASPLDAQSTATGVAWETLDAAPAVTACRDAIAALPKDARLQFQYGRALHKAGKYHEALEWYREAIEQGYIAASNSLGFMYQNGQGVTKDNAEAVRWYRHAAEQGGAVAQNNLAHMYGSGVGVPRNSAEAMKWYQLAADQGLAIAQFNIGLMHANGAGVAKDEAEAAKWYRKAAEQGYAAAQSNLGWMHANGVGVEKDEGEAIKWYREAAGQGYAAAQFSLGWMYANGVGVEKDEAEAVTWYQLAAAQGHAGARENLKLLSQLENVAREIRQLEEELRIAEQDALRAEQDVRAADEAFRIAQQDLRGAEAYEKEDYTTALREWLPIARGGYAPAQTAVGAMYANGEGVTKDEAEAVKWYRRAAEQGDQDAENSLEILLRQQQYSKKATLSATKVKDKRGVLVGNDTAPNTLEIYYSVGCPHCLEHFDAHLKELESYIHDGLLKVVLIDVSSVIGTGKSRLASVEAARALRCLSDHSDGDFSMLYSLMSMLRRDVLGDWTNWSRAESSRFRTSSGIVSPMDIGTHLLTEHGIKESSCYRALFTVQQVRGKEAFIATGASKVPYYVLNGVSLGDSIRNDGDASKDLEVLLRR